MRARRYNAATSLIASLVSLFLLGTQEAVSQADDAEVVFPK